MAAGAAALSSSVAAALSGAIVVAAGAAADPRAAVVALGAAVDTSIEPRAVASSGTLAEHAVDAVRAARNRRLDHRAKTRRPARGPCVRRSCRVIRHVRRGRRGGVGVHPLERPPLGLAPGVLAGAPSARMPCIRPGRSSSAAADSYGEAAVTSGAAAVRP